MSSSGQQKLDNKLPKFKDNPKIKEQDKKWVDKFLNEIKRAGAKNPGTQFSYLRHLELILENIDTAVSQLSENQPEKLEKLTDTVAEAVENSEYKRKDGHYSSRQKRMQWTCWKRVLETQGIGTQEYQDWMPKRIDLKTKKHNVNTRSDTTAQDLPTPTQFKKFLQSIGTNSRHRTALRNQALLLLLWDTGARRGEALNIKMRQVTVTKNRVHIKINGNKGSDDRRIEIFQGRETLKQYIQEHPKRQDPDAYLFYPIRKKKFYEGLSHAPIQRKIHQARRNADLDFKTKGEPFHIFRKAMTTYYIVNNVLSWEEVCNRQGKSSNATKPDYLKMAVEDVDAAAAESFGLNNSQREMDSRMRGPALMPKDCSECGYKNLSFKETCSSCGSQLPDAEMPDHLREHEEDLDEKWEDKPDDVKRQALEIWEKMQEETVD